MKKKMIKDIKKFKDPYCYIICSNEGCRFNGTGSDILTMLTMQIRCLKDDFPKEEFENAVKYAYMNDDELEKELLKRTSEFLSKLSGGEENGDK